MAFTYFFRDAASLELAIERALPALRGQAFIDVWNAGCAHGPEPYTLAILLRERMSDFLFRNVRIHATDVQGMFAESVSRAIFPEKDLQRIPPELFAKYFRPAAAPGHVQAIDALRSKIRFCRHDLLSLRPIREGLSLIVCKNVLLHFDERQRVEVLRMFHRALRTDGLLVTEHTQKLPASVAGLYQAAAAHAQIHARLDPPHRRSGPHAGGNRPSINQSHSRCVKRYVK